MYYQHSGRFSVGGIVLSLLTGAIAGFLLAYAYGNGLSHIPEVHLAAFATIAFGLFVGGTTGRGLLWGHVRSPRLTIAVTALTSTLALYLSWAMWIAEIFKRSQGRNISWARLAQHPVAIWSLMTWINHYGTWALDNGKPTAGWWLWIIWTVEALLIVGVAIATAVAMLGERAFCETCGRWCHRALRLLLAPSRDVQQLKLQLENKDLRALESLGPGQKGGDHLVATLHSCTQCQQFHTLTVTNTKFQRPKFGHHNVSSQTIVRQLIVGPAEAQTLRQLSQTLAQAPKLSPKRARGAAAGG